MKAFERRDRVGEEIHRLLAQAIQKELRDPRLQQTTITRVEVTRDLAYAKVYFSFLQHAPTQQDEKQLNKAAGFFRSQLAKRLTMRSVPSLIFAIDKAYIKGEVVRDLIGKLSHPANKDTDNNASSD